MRVPDVSSDESIPQETRDFMARDDALNSTGSVTSWKRTTAANAITPAMTSGLKLKKIPSIISGIESEEPIFATGSKIGRAHV